MAEHMFCAHSPTCNILKEVVRYSDHAEDEAEGLREAGYLVQALTEPGAPFLTPAVGL